MKCLSDYLMIDKDKNIISKFLRDDDTPAKQWLKQLPLYDCPECGVKTIFIKGCVKHIEDQADEQNSES